MAALPVWASTKFYGADAGGAAGARLPIAGAAIDLPKGYKLTVRDLLLASGVPAGWQDFWVALIETDGVTVVEEFGVMRFWLDGFETLKPDNLVFVGDTNDAGTNRIVRIESQDTGAVACARFASMTFNIDKR